MFKSFTWQYFEKLDRQESAKCKLCNKVIMCKGWSTSGLIRHLKGRQHMIVKEGAASRFPLYGPRVVKLEPIQDDIPAIVYALGGIECTHHDEDECIDSHPCYVTAKQVLTDEQEAVFVDYLEKATRLFYGLTSAVCKELAYQFVEHLGIECPRSWKLKDSAGHDWLCQFMRKNENIQLKRPEFSTQNVEAFQQRLHEVLEQHEFSSKDVYSVDEMHCSTMDGMQTETSVTAVGIVRACGSSLPLCFVFPSEKMDEKKMMGGAPPGSKGFCHPTGMMTSKDFVKVLEHIKEHSKCTPESPILLIMNDYKFHISIFALEYANNNGIILITIPPNTSSKLQPLHKCVFGPLKEYFSTALSDWQRCHPKRKLQYFELPNIVGNCWKKAAVADNVQAGFATTGIFPFSSNMVSESDFFSSSKEADTDPLDFEGEYPIEDEYPFDDDTDPQPSTSTGGKLVLYSSLLATSVTSNFQDKSELEKRETVENVDVIPTTSTTIDWEPISTKKSQLSTFAKAKQQSSLTKYISKETSKSSHPSQIQSTSVSSKKSSSIATPPIMLDETNESPKDRSYQQTVTDLEQDSLMAGNLGHRITSGDQISQRFITNCREYNSEPEGDLDCIPVYFGIDREPRPGDYVLLLPESGEKQTVPVYHVARILKEIPRNGDFTVLYLKHNQKSRGPSLFYPRAEDKAEVKKEQILSILPNVQPPSKTEKSTHQSQAVLYHHDKTLLGSNSDDVSQVIKEEKLSNDTFQHLNELWQQKLQNEGLNKVSTMEAIQTYAKKHPDITVKTDMLGENFIIVLVTDFMKRCHSNIEEVQRVCYIETAVHYNLYNTAVTVLLAESPAGAVPLGMVFTTDQDSSSYLTGFQLLKQALGPVAFFGKLQPEVFMTEDCSALREALESVWPGSSLALCSSKLLQCTWRKLSEKRYKVPKHDRLQLVSVMEHLINSGTPQKFNSTYTSLLKGSLSHHKQFINYVKRYVRRKSEWSQAFQYQKLPAICRRQGYNSCEPTLHIFNYIVLSRCNIYNTASLVMYMSEIFNDYLRQRFLDRVQGRKQKLFGQSTIDECEIENCGHLMFTMKSKDTETSYNVDLKMGTCSCQKKSCLIPCEHQVVCAEVVTTNLPEAATLSAEVKKTLTDVGLKRQVLQSGGSSDETTQAPLERSDVDAEGDQVMVKEEMEEVFVKYETLSDEEVCQEDLPSTSGIASQDLLNCEQKLQDPMKSQVSATTPQFEEIYVNEKLSGDSSEDEVSDDTDDVDDDDDDDDDDDETSTEGPSKKKRRLEELTDARERPGQNLTRTSPKSQRSFIPTLQSLKEEYLNQYEMFGVHVAKELSTVDDHSFRKAKTKIERIISKAKVGFQYS